MEIPLSRRVHCQFCNVIIDSNASSTWQVVKGWCRTKRPSGNSRGSNSISLGKWLDYYACDECISKLRAGIPPGQQALPFFNLETAE